MVRQQKNPDDIEFQKFMEEASLPKLMNAPSLPGGLETLEAIPGRKDLPIIEGAGRICLLVDIINHTPETYSIYLNELRRGAYFGPAAESVGIPTSTIARWGQYGRRDINEGLDTYYSRFWKDVRKAVAQCQVKVEQFIAKTDPKKWLARGPGTIFGDQWNDNRVEESSQLEEVESFSEQKLIEHVEEGTGVRTTVIDLDSITEEAAKEVLRELIKDRPADTEAEKKYYI